MLKVSEKTTEKNIKRFNMAISEELLNEIDKYRLSKGLEFPPSRAEVMRELLWYAIQDRAKK